MRWYAEGSDPEAYNVSVDTASPHSGKHSLRIAGGSGAAARPSSPPFPLCSPLPLLWSSGGQFDGLSASLPGASGAHLPHCRTAPHTRAASVVSCDMM